MTTKKILSTLLLISMIMFVTACDDKNDNPSPPIIEAINISPTNPTNETTLICAVLTSDKDGDLFSIKFVWTDGTSNLQTTKNTIENSGGSFTNNLPSAKVTAGAKITCKVTVTDKKGLNSQSEKSIQIQAMPENTPPVFSNIPAINLFVGEEINPINISLYVSDKEDSFADLKLSLVSQSNNSVISCYLENGYLKSDFALSPGYSTLTISAKDSAGKSDSCLVSVTVQEIPNSAPKIQNIPNQEIFLSELISPLDLSLLISDSEDEFNELLVNISQSNSGVINCSLSDGIISSGNSLQAGYSDITVQVTDSGGKTVSKTFRIIVKIRPNNAPILQNIPNQEIKVGKSITPIDLADFASDTEDSFSQMAIAIISQSNSAVVNCSLSNGTLSSGKSLQAGYSDVTIQVTDSGGKIASKVFKITVLENDPPKIGKIEDQKVILGEAVNPLDLLSYLSDDKDDPNELLVTITSQSNSEMLLCYINNSYIKSYESNYSGTSEVTITVKDSDGLTSSTTFTITVAPPPLTYRLTGLNFGPFMNGQSPGDYISEEQIRQRMQIITPYTKWIRTFTSTGGIEASGKIAHELNLKIAMGAWLDSDNSTNQIEMENLIEAAKDGYVDIAIIGSEVLLRNALNESKLIEYINQFKNEVPWIPVTYGDVYSELISHPNVIDACSIIFANYYPYWEGIHIEDALANLHGQHEKMMEAANGKEVWVSETGWPSDGATINEAVPSLENACSYFLNFASWAQAEKVNYLYFEAFDEAWKANGGTEQEAHWGIWDQYGNLKEGMEEVFLGETTEDNWTCALLVGNPNLDPEIGLTFVPEIGSSLNLTGFASNLIPKYYRIAVYIRVGGGWWTKPYWSSPATLIGCDGNWVCDITTGGHDGSADAIAAFLIPVFYSPPAMPVAGGGATLPLELETNSLDSIIVYRE